MDYSQSFFSFHTPPSFWLLTGIIGGLIAPFPFLIFSLFGFCSVAAFQINKKIFLPLLLLSLGGITSSLRINSLLKNSVLKKQHCSTGPFIVQGIAKTGTSYWPHKITVKENSSSFSFFIFCKKEPSCLPQDTLLSSALTFKQPDNQDFLRYLFKEGVQGTAFIEELSPEIIVRPYASFWRWTYLKRKHILHSLRKKISRPCYSFFCSLFIGDKKQSHYLTEKYKPLFKKWGISHQMARSGLHLIIFIFLWQLLLSFFPFSFLKKHFFLFALCLFYFLLTPSSISFIRAFFLFFFYKFCSFFSWQIHSTHLLFMVASICLLYNPFQLFFLDFQLSFFLAFCLSWLAHINQQRRALS